MGALNNSNSDNCEESINMGIGMGLNMSAEVVDGFERKSFEVLEYVNNLEAKLQQEKDEFLQKEMQLLSDRKAFEQKMELALQQAKLEKSRLQQQNGKVVNDADSTIHSLTNDLDSSSLSLRKERRKALELENLVAELKQEMDHKERVHNRRKARDEKEKARLDDELNALRKKVNLGRILGSLQEVYLCLDNEGEKDCQRSRHEFNDKDGTSFKDSSNLKPEMKMDSLERKVQCLIDSCVVQSPKAAYRRDDNNGWCSDSDSESGRDELDATNWKSVEQKVRVLRQIRRPQSVPPPVAHRRKPQANEDDVSPAGEVTTAIFDERLKAGIETTSETHPQRLKSSKCQPRARSVPRTTSSRPQTPMPSHKSPSKMIKTTPSRATSPQSPKQDSAMDEMSEGIRNGCISSAVSSPKEKELSRLEIFRRQRDIQKLISSMESNLNSMVDFEKRNRLTDSSVNHFMS